MLKPIAITIAVTAIVATGLFINDQSQSPAERPAPPTGPTMIYAAGRIEGASDEIQLRPQLAGKIERLLVSDGQQVEEGELLLQLDDAQYGYEAAQAEAILTQQTAALAKLINGARDLERQEAAALYRAQLADLERAQLSWRRVQQLRADKAISQQEADNERTAVDALQAKVEAAKARMALLEAPARDDEVAMARARIAAAQATFELAKVQLERTLLVAPTDGQILQVNVRQGELTGPESTVPPIIFADTSHYRVRAFVEELDAPRVKAGMTATITADGMAGKTFKGQVTRISPRMGPKKLFTDDPSEQYDVKTREVWVDMQTNEPLVIGLRVDVTIHPQDSAAPTVPSS